MSDDNGRRFQTPRNAAWTVMHHGWGQKISDAEAYQDKQLQIVGLLQLILEQLQELSRSNIPKRDSLAVHREWLNYYRGRYLSLCDRFDKASLRVSKFCDLSLLPKRPPPEDIHQAYRIFGQSHDFYSDVMRVLEEAVLAWESVKSIDDIVNLPGIGKKRAAKIVAKMAELSAKEEV